MSSGSPPVVSGIGPGWARHTGGHTMAVAFMKFTGA
jgi:hypothetical protein